jgi:hypothetical protein
MSNSESPEAVDEGPACSKHRSAPHGFNRNASHNAGRHVCDCEGWAPEPHSAGPWSATSDAAGWYVLNSAGSELAHISPPDFWEDVVYTEAQGDANAYLLAAAPEMFAVIKTLILPRHEAGMGWNARVRWAQSVIAKAQGFPEPTPAASGNPATARPDDTKTRAQPQEKKEGQ